jgi:uncharacterized protein HemX
MSLDTILGSVETAPKSTDASSVILWVISLLVVALAIAVIKLYSLMREQRAECREEAAASRAETASLRKQNQELYTQAIEATAERESKLTEVVERNTAALYSVKDAVGSGVHRSILDKRDNPNRH